MNCLKKMKKMAKAKQSILTKLALIKLQKNMHLIGETIGGPIKNQLHLNDIPYIRILQKQGDLVHWVQSIGLCNNISWNVAPLTNIQYKAAIERYRFNSAERYQSIIPIIHMSWNIAKAYIEKEIEINKNLVNEIR